MTLLVIIAAGNGLLHVWCKATVRINANLSSIRPQGTYSKDIPLEIPTLTFQEMLLNRLMNKL